MQEKYSPFGGAVIAPASAKAENRSFDELWQTWAGPSTRGRKETSAAEPTREPAADV